MKLTPNQKYEVFWQDCEHSNDWIPYNEIDNKIIGAEQPIKTIGYFLKETKNSYAFTSGINESGKEYFDLIVIPKKVVQKINKIKVDNKGRKN